MEMTVDCKIVDSMQKILPKTIIKSERNVGKFLSGETADFQLVFNNRSASTIKFAKIEIEGEIKDRVKILAEDLVPLTTFPECPTDDYYSTLETGLVPDLLRELRKTDICLYHDMNKAFFVSVDTRWLSAKAYDIDFVLKCGGTVCGKVNYKLEIIESSIEKSDLILTNWMHYDCISNYYGYEVFSDDFYAVFEKFLAEYVDIGFNMIYTPLFTPPLDTYVGGERKTAQLIDVKKNCGKYSFSFQKLEKFMNFCLERGIKFFEFSHLFTQWGGKACPKIICETDGKTEKLFGWEEKSDGENYTAFLDAFLPELVCFIHNKGLEYACFFHLTDEPCADDIIVYSKCRDAVKKYVGNMRILDAISKFSFLEKGLVDIAVPIINVYEKFRERYKGDLFVYYCCCPTDNYYTNRLLYMPLQRTRILGIQLYINGAKGFLHWGFNFYNTAFSYSAVDPYKENDAGGLFPSGDSFIVYPDKENDGIRSTMRAKAMKRAFADYELLKTLERMKGKNYVADLLQAEKVSGFSDYPKDDRWIDDLFDRIREIIKNDRNNF